jgi:hypothetical protein
VDPVPDPLILLLVVTSRKYLGPSSTHKDSDVNLNRVGSMIRTEKEIVGASLNNVRILSSYLAGNTELRHYVKLVNALWGNNRR